jgi:predicted nucleotidyltransferase
MNILNKQILADDRVLAELVRRLVEAFHPERIFFFGSKARGEAGQGSDYDLLVLVGDEAPPERRRSRLVYHALRRTLTATDVLVWSQKEFERRLHWPPPCRPSSTGKEFCFMPADPVLIAETQAWLRKAANDLRAAGHSLRAGRYVDGRKSPGNLGNFNGRMIDVNG